MTEKGEMSENGKTDGNAINGSPYHSVPGLEATLDGGVLSLRLDRTDRRNAIEDVMMTALIDYIDAAGRDEAVRAILLAGNGDHFCGGADIVARNAPGAPRPRTGSIQRRLPSQAHRLIPLVLSVQVPVVCAVRGWAAGIGFQLALAADFAVVATDARLWEPFISRGFTPDSGATWLLPRLVGIARARQLLLLGKELSGAEAAEWGLVHAAVESDAVETVAAELASELAAGPTVALGLTKWLLHAGSSSPLDDQLRNEAFGLELSSRTEDFREGLKAFKEHRAPKFEGR
jgi:2-(1,2-epoxy-1,2-dihydrophenyl)acetyl-CoA isomerase